jgi:hypothetical protein
MTTYLEDRKNYTVLFGDGSKTGVGVIQMTKIQAFEVFATWMNQLNPDLLLNGRRLQQQFDQWKRNYIKTKRFKEITGAGLENEDGPQALYKILEESCPCYHLLNALFGNKANITLMYQPVQPLGP